MAGENGVGNDSMDRISELPDEIRELILGYLPINDAVRTSALSRKWKYSWTRAVQVNIEIGKSTDDHIDLLTVEDIDEHNDTVMEGDEYQRVVGKVLLSHVGLIHKFVLRLNHRPFGGDMNSWMLLLLRKGIKDLTIKSGYCGNCADLPSSIFRFLGLSCLTLMKFDLKSSIALRGFPNLVRLSLHRCTIFENIHEKIISSCPLEILVIDSCLFAPPCIPSDHYKTEINAPNLRELKIVFSLLSICYSSLSYTPHLKVATLTCDVYGVGCALSNFFDILGSMQEIEDFTLDFNLHKASTSDIIPKKLLEPLLFLKTVNLLFTDVTSSDHMLFISFVIRSSPNLQNLAIQMDFRDRKLTKVIMNTASAFLEAEGKELIKSKITTLSVTFNDVEGIQVELALIDNIVSWSPTLKKMFIKRSQSVIMSEKAKLQLARAIRRFRSSSGRPDIIYL